MANSVCLYSHVFRRSFVFEVEGQRKKGRPKKTWEKQVEDESMKFGMCREAVHFTDQSAFLALIVVTTLR